MDHSTEARPKHFRLASGRQIGWLEFGPEDGYPAVYSHGTPGSALEAEVFASAAWRQGVRVIAVDRPGIGDSDPDGGDTIAKRSEDAAQLLDHLGCSQYAVFGWSGGAPYALLTALARPDRARAVGLLAPQSDRHLLAARIERRLARPYQSIINAIARVPRLGVPLLEAAVKTADPHPRSERPSGRRIFGESLKRSQWQGSGGTLDDTKAIFERWGMSVAEIATRLEALAVPPPITIWQGAHDQSIGLSNTRALARQLPNTTLWIDQPASHLQILLDHTDEVLRTLRRSQYVP